MQVSKVFYHLQQKKEIFPKNINVFLIFKQLKKFNTTERQNEGFL